MTMSRSRRGVELGAVQGVGASKEVRVTIQVKVRVDVGAGVGEGIEIRKELGVR